MRCPICNWNSDKKQRSNCQNRYFHGYIIPALSSELGNTPIEMKGILKGLFLRRWAFIGEKEVEYIEDTSDLNTEDFEKFLKEIREWASIEMGIYLKLPNEGDANEG